MASDAVGAHRHGQRAMLGAVGNLRLPTSPTSTVQVRCPGRVTVIGDHTDYCQGLSLAVATDLATEVVVGFDSAMTTLTVVSDADPEPVTVDIDVPLAAGSLQSLHPLWARYVAATVAVVRPEAGGRASIRSSLPLGAGLSSSAALTVSLALALGLRADPLTAARTCQRAEQAATDIEVGMLDHWTVLAAKARTALLLDFHDMTSATVPWPEGLELIVVHCGTARALARSGYQARRAECDAASFRLGPLGHVDPAAVLGLPDPVLRRRARHVVTECDRVRWFVDALQRGEPTEAGRLMTASHRSLAEDFEVSTPALDGLVDALVRQPGVLGARLTGAGFGGCAVALTEPGALDPADFPTPAWRIQPADGATLVQSPAG